jgi:hypothetical protein
MSYFNDLGIKPIDPTTVKGGFDIDSLPIAGFHEDPKKGKDPKVAYVATVISRDRKVKVAASVGMHYKVTVGTSYRSHIVALLFLKIAESQGATLAELEVLKRVVAWTGRISHEGGSLGGFTPSWAELWTAINTLVSPHAVLGIKATGEYQVYRTKKLAVADGASIHLRGANALDWLMPKLLKDEECKLSREAVGVYFRTRIISTLMSKLEAGKDKPMHHAALEWRGLTYLELATLAGTLARGSKGILGQEWNVNNLLEGGKNFAKTLTPDVVNRAFPKACFAKEAVLSLRSVHIRLHDLAVKRHQDKENRMFQGV